MHRPEGKHVLAVVGGFLCLAGSARAQVDQQLTERFTLPQFYVDALVFAGSDSAASRLDVYVQVPYQGLSFVKTDEVYNASYEETISIFDSSDNLLVEKTSTESIHRKKFFETTDPQRYNLTQQYFRVVPGRYNVVVQVLDEDTRKSFQQKHAVLVRPLHWDSLAMSDLMLVSDLRMEGDKRIIVPNITGNVSNLRDGFYLFFEVYNNVHCDSVELNYQVVTTKNETKLTERFVKPIMAGSNQLFVKINSSSLAMGSYVVLMQAAPYSSGKHGQGGSRAFHAFVVRLAGIPTSIEDLDAAIDQLLYIAESDQLDSIRAGKTVEERYRRFREFWKKRDPTPDSERNEDMEQYYRRVVFANKNFSHYMEGWKTDRGMVYIMFGPPSNIDRHPFDSDAKPYETWFYNDLNYQFLFVDQTGFGDYRLDPSTPLWNIRNRRR